jgi:hypothetical protein
VFCRTTPSPPAFPRGDTIPLGLKIIVCDAAAPNVALMILMPDPNAEGLLVVRLVTTAFTTDCIV